ncbi:MAG TPA: aldo/keto reductase, partial [Tepidisphaeraceae bacterium]
MEKRKLGRSGLEAAPLAFGGNVFGWTADEPTSFRLLDAFVDAGFNLIDTADIYSRWVPGNKGGESETILGNWLKRSGKRDKVLIATKAGMDMGEGKKGLSRRYLFQAIEDSLRRLRVDVIDLYQAHQDDPNTPLEETLGAFAELVKQGKVRAIGASNYNAARLAEALRVSQANGWPRYETLQPHYNLYEREPFERDLEPLCEREGLGVISYFSLASGFLTGKYRTEADLAKSARGSGVKKYLNDR